MPSLPQEIQGGAEGSPTLPFLRSLDWLHTVIPRDLFPFLSQMPFSPTFPFSFTIPFISLQLPK